MPKKRLLIVDDVPEVGDFVENVGRGLGFDTLVVNDSQEFEAAYQSFRPDVVVVDVVMPKVDGMELITYLAKERSDARILVMSGYNELYLDLAEKLGSWSGLKQIKTLSKPIEVAEMERALIGES